MHKYIIITCHFKDRPTLCRNEKQVVKRLKTKTENNRQKQNLIIMANWLLLKFDSYHYKPKVTLYTNNWKSVPQSSDRISKLAGFTAVCKYVMGFIKASGMWM